MGVRKGGEMRGWGRGFEMGERRRGELTIPPARENTEANVSRAALIMAGMESIKSAMMPMRAMRMAKAPLKAPKVVCEGAALLSCSRIRETQRPRTIMPERIWES